MSVEEWEIWLTVNYTLLLSVRKIRMMLHLVKWCFDGARSGRVRWIFNGTLTKVFKNINIFFGLGISTENWSVNLMLPLCFTVDR